MAAAAGRLQRLAHHEQTIGPKFVWCVVLAVEKQLQGDDVDPADVRHPVHAGYVDVQLLLYAKPVRLQALGEEVGQHLVVVDEMRLRARFLDGGAAQLAYDLLRRVPERDAVVAILRRPGVLRTGSHGAGEQHRRCRQGAGCRQTSSLDANVPASGRYRYREFNRLVRSGATVPAHLLLPPTLLT